MAEVCPRRWVQTEELDSRVSMYWTMHDMLYGALPEDRHGM